MKITNCPIIIRSITLAVVVLLLSSGNGDRVSKVTKCRCTVHDPITIQNVSCWSKSINRTFAVANFRLNISQPINNVFVNFELFRKADIQYRPFLINITEDYCAFIAKNRASKSLRILARIYLQYTNFNHTCPYKGEMFLKNMPLPIDKIPSIWPTGEYRLDIVCFEAQRKLITIEMYGEINESFRTETLRNRHS